MIEDSATAPGSGPTRYGEWTSPITAELVASSSITVTETRLCDGVLYWLERRPLEAGRTTIVRHDGTGTADILPADYNCRSRVHEYGGGSYAVADDNIFFVNDADQQIYQLTNGSARQVTRASACRFCDIQLDTENNRLVCICEDHSKSGLPENRLVCITLDEGIITTLCDAHDFYSSPRLNHVSNRLAWLSWDFPAMPWQASSLHVAQLEDNNHLGIRSIIAGGHDVSICQPEWHDGHLYYVSDANGWWNIYRHEFDEEQAVLALEAEFTLPHWVFGQSCYCFSNNRMLASGNSMGRHQLYRVDLDSLDYDTMDTGHTHYEYLTGDDDRYCCIASSESVSSHVIAIDSGGKTRSITRPETELDSDMISGGQAVTFQSRYGDDVHATWYAPLNRDFNASTQEAPPLIVLSHGGPTGQANRTLDIKKQFWTSRGFAILDVDYSGSTGYGRDYRERLDGSWGIRDVHDVCDGALAMVEQGLADRDRLIIKGSSAGGYTTLAALTFENVFMAGASYYGISDLETLVTDTHKFEARYLDTLVGDYPEQRSIYIERSPIHHAGLLSCPVIFLQGEEDRVVPKQQAETMMNALISKDIAVAYRLYPQEQHGFRRAETIIDALESELCFYLKLFINRDADCALDIINLKQDQ